MSFIAHSLQLVLGGALARHKGTHLLATVEFTEPPTTGADLQQDSV
ncbi:hypothetical protein PR001_g5022 [Phytophthora rubi]|uniref:Uncharacterized protein n=1 Tax=Phytophthora rubi TaxID=129364 RepID=A0A6A3N6P6_9STRA|nr:hypothetical protein PR002_g5229 [Phytophthora rubi]KAE9045303.1 hypothetical protein PR001_g5022 [Phytophthora rubi]